MCVDKAQGPVRDIVTEPEYLDIMVGQRAASTTKSPMVTPSWPTSSREEGYFDPVRDPYEREQVGVNYFDMQRHCVCETNTLVQYQPTGGHIEVETKAHPVRFILASRRPIREQIAWYGPIVMNTR